MKRLMILLMVVLAVGMMAGIVNAQMMSQDFGVENFPFETSFHSTSVAITHTGTGPTDLGFEASGYTTTNSPAGWFGVFNNRFEIEHFSSYSGRVLTEAADPTWGVDFGDPRTGYIRFDSVPLTTGSSLSMSIGEMTAAGGDDDVVIRVYVNGEAGLGKDIFDTRGDASGTIDSGDAVGGATYDETTATLSYDFADTDTSVILYVAITNDGTDDGYYIDEVAIGNAYGLELVSPIDWALTTLTELVWVRPDPNGPGTEPQQLPEPFNVNVIFGTDENLDPADSATVEIETDADIDSTSAFPTLLENTRYYWRVDVIDPNAGGSPFIIEGPIWSFLTTIPWEVAATDTATVSEQDPIDNRDTIILSLSKDPETATVDVTITEPHIPRSDTFEEMDSFSEVAPKLTVVYDGATLFETSIAVQNDDAEQDLFEDGRMDRGSSDLEFFNDGTSEQIIGLRFTGVTIPQGATIESARVDFRIDSTSPSGEVHGIVTGEDVDNAAGIGSLAYALTDRFAANPTSATSSFMWTEDYIVGNIVPTGDISEVIQEIVNRTLWAPGYSILLFFTEDTSVFYPYELDFIDTDTLAVLGQGSWTYQLDTSNWAGLTVTIAAVDDDDLEADPEVIDLAVTTSSTTGEWDGLTDDDVVVDVLENECGAWPLSVYDFNLNCVIDLGDLAIFAAEWQACTMPNDTLGLCVDTR